MTQMSAFLIFTAMQISLVSPRLISVKSVSPCDPKFNYSIGLIARNKVEGDAQLHDWKFSLSEPLSNDMDVLYEVIAERIYGTKMRKLFGIHNKGACKALSMYAAEEFKKLAAIMKIKEVEKCPIPKGIYHLHWYPVNFDVDIFKMIPNGSYRVTINITENGKPVICVHGIGNKKS